MADDPRASDSSHKQSGDQDALRDIRTKITDYADPETIREMEELLK